jgi:hypothetical protein
VERTCRHRTLAHGPAGSVQQCLDCGVISLHVGAVTLRVDPATAEALWAVLGNALHELRAEPSMHASSRAVGRA